MPGGFVSFRADSASRGDVACVSGRVAALCYFCYAKVLHFRDTYKYSVNIFYKRKRLMT